MTAGARVTSVSLIVLMAIGSIVLWLGVPIGWFYLAFAVTNTSQPSLLAYGMVLVGVPVTMVYVGRGLSRLNHAHAHVTGNPIEGNKVAAPWHKSMRDDRGGPRRSVLDLVMAVSVAFAMLLLGIWFLFFAKGGGI